MKEVLKAHPELQDWNEGKMGKPVRKRSRVVGVRKPYRLVAFKLQSKSPISNPQICHDIQYARLRLLM